MSTSLQSRFVFYRFIAWLIVVACFLIAFGFIMLKESPLNSNVLDLLPQSHHNPVATQAAQQFSNTMGEQLLFLVGDRNQDTAQQAAQIFAMALRQSHAFKNITDQVTMDTQNAWGSFYFPYRLSLLTPQQHDLLQAGDTQKIVQMAMLNLYSPMALTNSALLETDPLFMFQSFVMSMPKPASHLGLYGEYMVVQAHDQWYVMINTQIRGGSFSLSEQNKLIDIIKKAEQQTQQQYIHSNIIKTGMLFYAKAGADQAQHDVSTIGIGSVVGIVLLLVLTFRSLSPLLLTLFSSAVGFIAAFVVTYWVFGSVYLFTLVFGASLIGISVDYAFFYYADRLYGGPQWLPLDGLRHIFSGISLGLLNVVLAFMVIALAPFPGVRQLAVFAITGLALSYATVVCAFPYWLKAKQHDAHSLSMGLSNAYLSLWKALSKRSVIIIYAMIAVFVVAGLLRLQSNDDIHILQATPAALKHDEQLIKDLIGSSIGTRFIVVQGTNPEQMLTNTHSVTQIIKTAFPGLTRPYIAISDYLPTVAAQQENYHLTQSLLTDKTLLPYLNTVGVTPDQGKAILQKLSAIAFKPLTLQAWLDSPVSDSLRYLYLNRIDGQYATVILLSDQIDTQILKNQIQGFLFATYIDKADEVTSIFKIYRKIISTLLGFAFVILLILLIWRYGFKLAKYYFIPPLCACLLGVAVLGWLGIPLTLFNVLALVLVLGLAVDYVLFFAESKSTYQSTMLAVLLSAITTVLSFGLLAFSTTPVIHYFGVTVFVGIVSAFLLAPLVTRIRPEQKN